MKRKQKNFSKKSAKGEKGMNIRFKISQPDRMLKQIKETERWIFLTILVVCLFLVLNKPLSLAQENFKSITLLYTNNINAEIDPCPV